VDQNEAIVAVMSMAIGAATLLGILNMWWRGRRNVASATVASFENRLARLEVALDDVTAELGRVTDSNQLLLKALAERQALPLT
jgi:Flp pilus assembly protein CpaB